MHTINQLFEAKLVLKSGKVTLTGLTKRQSEEMQYNIELSQFPKSLGKLTGTKWIGSVKQAEDFGFRLVSDYDSQFGWEHISPKLKNSLVKIGTALRNPKEQSNTLVKQGKMTRFGAMPPASSTVSKTKFNKKRHDKIMAKFDL